jgi:hypothetical protein
MERVERLALVAVEGTDAATLQGARQAGVQPIRERAGILERCREALSEVAQEESRLGERVRSALSSMRSQEELSRAVEKRRADVGSDGAKKEKGKSKRES